MKYVILIIDGASGWPIPEHGGRTSLEIAGTPNLDSMVREGILGLCRTVPEGMEASSACACMSILGYDPRVYYRGRGGIEARSLDIPIGADEVVFRCNLVAVRDGRMWDYSAGHISTEEARELVTALNEHLSGEDVSFYPGVGYRHICKLKGHQDTLAAVCTPPHDIPEKPVGEYLPGGNGSRFLRELMARSEAVLESHPVNKERCARGETPATMIWLFWGSSRPPDMPAFRDVYGLRAALTSGVDLLRGLARLAGIGVLELPGVTDGVDNDCAAQAEGAIAALGEYDLVVIHVEAPDEAAHGGSVREKVAAIERVDAEIVSRLRRRQDGNLRVLVLPDHATPLAVRTHVPDPVPFMLWGKGVATGGAVRFSEAQAGAANLFIDPGYNIIERLVT